MRERTVGLLDKALIALIAPAAALAAVGTRPPEVIPFITIDVMPEADTLVVQDTLWLRALVRDSLGKVITGQPVAWSSSRTAVAPVSGTGDSIRLRAGPSLGSAIITASLRGQSDSAWITVLSLSVKPTAAKANIGSTVPFFATARDSSGSEVPRSLFWSSADPSTAEIVAQAGVTAMALTKRAGTTQIIVATRRGGSASATVTIIDTTTLAGECADRKPQWIWCDDFEADRLASYFEFEQAGGRFRRDSTAGRNDSYGMRASFGDRRRTAGSLKVAIGRVPTGIRAADTAQVARRELYWRVYVLHDSLWAADRGARLIQGTSLVSRLGAQAMAAYVWSGDARPHHLAVDPATGTDEAGNIRTNRYDDFASLRWLGPTYSRTAVLDSSRVGQWQCVEAFARLNAAGRSDAVFRLWVNDSLEAERTGFNWVGDYRDFGLNAVIIENVLGEGARRQQERRYDNLVISTARIGCQAGSR